MALARQMQPATLADFLAIPEGERFHELLAGEIVQRALPSARHGGAQVTLGGTLLPYQRRRGPGPSGWVFAVEAEVQLFLHTVVRPDVLGWRRERLPRLPDLSPIDVTPDWVCEVLSPSNAKVDLWDKQGLYHEAGIQHYWIVDPMTESLRVLRWAEAGYDTVLDARGDATVRAEPFDEVEIHLPDLFDAEPAAAPAP